MNRISWPALLLALLAGCVPARLRPVPQASDSSATSAAFDPALPAPDPVVPPPPQPPPDRLPDFNPAAVPPASLGGALSSFANRQSSSPPTVISRPSDPTTELPPINPSPRPAVSKPIPKPLPEPPANPGGPDLPPDGESSLSDRPPGRLAPQPAGEAQLPVGDRPAGPRGLNLRDNSESPGSDRLSAEGMRRPTSGMAQAQSTEPRARASGGPTVRMVNGKRLRLGFQVRSSGSDPVPVELWYTRDGKAWQRDDSPPQLRSPYVMEVREEGVYGLSLIPCSGARAQTPQAGDPPQFWVSVDWTRPTVTVLGVEADLRRKALSVRWSAGDDHLTSRPITLSYAEMPGGPWVPLAANLKNTGSFWGPLPPSMPPRFYLRVEAADQGGNVGEARTLTPVVLDASPPPNKVQVLGVDVNED